MRQIKYLATNDVLVCNWTNKQRYKLLQSINLIISHKKPLSP